MTGLPGKQLASFTAGELDRLLWYRDDLKYRHAGLSLARNVEIAPQGGFRQASGTAWLGQAADSAARIVAFRNSRGDVLDMVFGNQTVEAWQGTAKLDTLDTPLTQAQLRQATFLQRDDTLLVFHPDHETPRVKQLSDDTFEVDTLPYENIPTFDYGGPVGGGSYSNGVAAVWDLDFVNFREENGLTLDEIAFTLTISGLTTPSILTARVGTSTTNLDEDVIASRIQTAILDLPGVAAGVTAVRLADNRIRITFAGEENLGDQWTVSAEVINRATAAIVAYKSTVGVLPGEPIISNDRGWPRWGVFYQQRLVTGGFKSRPGDYMASNTGDFFNFDTRPAAATGAFVIPVEVEGGEVILHAYAGRNLSFFTSDAEYWLAERKLSKTEAPVHVQASRNGIKAGVPIVENEGAQIYAHAAGDTLSEFRYTDVDGNFLSQTITVLATHLIEDVTDQAARRAQGTREGNQLFVVNAAGSLRIATLLRQQEVTAFTRYETGGEVKAVCVNANNEAIALIQRTTNEAAFVNRERFEPELLLQMTVSGSNGPASATITGLGVHEAAEVWCIADNDVLGPFTVTGGAITCARPVTSWQVGRWTPPVIETLPLSREIGPQISKQTKLRIATVKLYLIDTTSIAIAAVDGNRTFDIDLKRFGVVQDGAELTQGFTGWVTVPMPPNMQDMPRVRITQVRPGRMLVGAMILEAPMT